MSSLSLSQRSRSEQRCPDKEMLLMQMYAHSSIIESSIPRVYLVSAKMMKIEPRNLRERNHENEPKVEVEPAFQYRDKSLDTCSVYRRVIAF